MITKIYTLTNYGLHYSKKKIQQKNTTQTEKRKENNIKNVVKNQQYYRQKQIGRIQSKK